jgi:hypothetical protein
MKMKMRMKVAGGAIREKENMKSGRESIFTVSEGGETGSGCSDLRVGEAGMREREKGEAVWWRGGNEREREGGGCVAERRDQVL